jgi:hypothetical protein
MTVSSSTNRASYSGNGSLATFAYGFKVFDRDDLTVILRASDGTETVQTITTDYTVTGVGDVGGGNVVFGTAPASGVTVVIIREQPLTQGLDLVPNDPFPAQSLEESLDKLTFVDQRLSESIDRALTFSVGDFVTDATLPFKEQRVGKVLAFNETTGDPEAGPSIADTQSVANASADIKTLAEIQDGTVATDAITNVNTIRTDVTTVSGMSSNVTTVAGNTTNINTVAGNNANITTVAGIDSDITTVSGISSDVTTVAADGTDIGVVAGISSDVTTVSGVSTEIGRLGTADAVSDMNALSPAAVIADMDSLADNVSAITAVSDDIGYVIAVAINAGNINDVAGNEADITTVASDISNVNTVSTNITSVNTNATNITDIQNASTNAATATTQAGIATTQAGIATTKASEASVSGVNAASSATASQAARDTAEDYKLAAEAAATSATNTASALAGFDLTAIAKDISDTAVDVFVYDTRKDSDGGAWRKRTQNTSWYNETLNTSTRGSRKEFPAVAVIVAETNQVTIYDGDDPDLPMWMVFNINGENNFLLTGVSSITSINGKIALGNTGSYARLMLVDFLAEESYWITSNSVTVKQQGIASRNSTTVNVNSSNYGTIVNSAVNDVAMTVLPNAPIDAATGLPVPTIAVATNGGVSVIKDDGTVVDITNTFANYNRWSSVKITTDNKLIIDASNVNLTNNITHVVDMPTADVSAQLVNARFTALNGRYYHSDSSIPNISLGGTFEPSIAPMQKDQFAMGGDNASYGLDIIAEAPETVSGISSSAMIAYIKSDYNTGWMNGDIKLATLSDTDDTDVTGSELVTNGTFASNTTGWSATNSGILSVDSARLKVTNGIASAGRAHQAITVEVGKTYTISVEGLLGTSGPNIRIGNAANGADYGSSTAAGLNSFTVIPTQTTIYITLKPNSNTNGNTALFDNVSVRLAEEDRSVNGNGLQVFGTVTKTPVATGADLVAYSGFSSSNYLEQPYNSDLDFGTGDCCGMAWFKHEATALTRTIFDRDSATTDKAISFEIAATNSYLQISLDDGTDRVYVNSGSAVDDDTWHFGTWVRRGSTLELYVDGVLKNTGDASSVDSISSTDARLRVGDYRRSGLSLPFGGSIALLRISATAPSPEQIAKIYNDEKVLFQENAQATLYGSSDAVTALAYDDSTELLHVGTSAGRSVFQGLRRVDNTTDAVGAAISASNGLVAED